MRFPVYFLLCFFAYIGLPKNAFAQFPNGYFRSPIHEKIELAGNFGELRPNHFHTGIDIKICGTEGLPIYAVADGYISRIGISPVGYGNVIYIDHPNGYTTVYGHLYKLGNDYAKYTRQKQYKDKSFAQDFLLEKDRFPVKKGYIIGFGGNSGGSQGAHLHFEIRETKSEKPVNPLLFGFNVPDTISPVIRSIKIYPLEKNSFVQVNYTNKKVIKGYEGQSIKLEAVKYKGNFYLKGVSSIHAHGPIGFAVQANDYLQGTYNTMGIYGIELCLNGERQYAHQMQKLDFSLKRYINAHTDFTEKSHSGRWYEKSFIKGNNQLPIYIGLKNNGIIDITEGKEYNINYYLKDVNENLSTLSFSVLPVAEQLNPIAAKINDSGIIRIPYNKPFNFEQENFILKVPQNTFYDDINCEYAVKPKTPKSFSSVYEFGTHKIPVHSEFDIALKPEFLPERLKDKACLISQTSGYLGGNYDNGWMRAKSKTLGKFYVLADTTPPVIIPGNIKAAGSNMWKSTGIRFKISDNLSGIKSYNGYVDGNWVLFQYDAKSALIYYLFDEYCPPGAHTLEMEITDDRGNVRRWKASFTR